MAQVDGIENFLGNSCHSSVFRTSEPYVDRRVLILGSGPSGIDIAKIVSKVAKKVFLSHRSPIERQDIVPPIIDKPWVSKVNATSVKFSDETIEEIDDIIFCTGKTIFPYKTN